MNQPIHKEEHNKEGHSDYIEHKKRLKPLVHIQDQNLLACSNNYTSNAICQIITNYTVLSRNQFLCSEKFIEIEFYLRLPNKSFVTQTGFLQFEPFIEIKQQFDHNCPRFEK